MKRPRFFPLTFLYCLSLASFAVVELQAAERGSVLTIVATPAALLIGYLRVGMGRPFAWSAPLVLLLLAVAVDTLAAGGCAFWDNSES